MPKPIKKRVLKKTAINKEEEIKNSFEQILESLKERKNLFLSIIAIMVVAGILSIVAIYYFSSLKDKAYRLQAEAHNYYYGINLKGDISKEERWKKALELYKESIETKSSPVALFYLGNCYYNLSDYKKAIEEYERFIKMFKNERELLPLVYQKLSSAYFNNGEKEKALTTLTKLAQIDDSIFNDTALILEARYYERMGDSDKAKERYKGLIEKFPNSPWVDEARIKIGAQKKEQ